MRCVMPSILAEDEQKPMHMLNITSYSVNWTQVFTESQSCVWDWLRFEITTKNDTPTRNDNFFI